MTPSAIAVLVSMAIAGGGGGGGAGGVATVQSVSAISKVGTVGSQSVTAQSGIANGDLLLLVQVLRNSTNEVPTGPGGAWGTHAATAVGGVGSWGAESGDSRVTLWQKVADGTESGTSLGITWTDTTASAAVAFLIRISGANSGWQTSASSSGEDETGPAISVTGGSTITFFTNDVIFAFFGTNTSNGAGSNAAISVSGVTLGAVTVDMNDSTFIANDAAVYAFHATVTSGSGSAVAPQASLDWSEGTTPATTGPILFFRVRNAP
jgi:hypothetical protein